MLNFISVCFSPPKSNSRRHCYSFNRHPNKADHYRGQGMRKPTTFLRGRLVNVLFLHSSSLDTTVSFSDPLFKLVLLFSSLVALLWKTVKIKRTFSWLNPLSALPILQLSIYDCELHLTKFYFWATNIISCREREMYSALHVVSFSEGGEVSSPMPYYPF